MAPSVSSGSSLSLCAEFPAKSEDKDGNSLAFQFLSGAKVTVQASKSSRESHGRTGHGHRSGAVADVCVCLFRRAVPSSERQLRRHVVGGEGAGAEVQPAFLQSGGQRLQEELQRPAPAAGLLPVCGPPLPGAHSPAHDNEALLL